MKRCSTCKIEKPIEDFSKDVTKEDGLRNYCKSCAKKARRGYKTSHRIEEKKRLKLYLRSHPEQKAKRRKRWKKAHPENQREARRRQYWNHHDHQLLKLKRKRLFKKSDPGFRLNEAVSASMRQALRGRKNGHHWETLAGYSLDQLMVHLEKQFKPGMTWNNFGEWEIDHRRPIHSFYFQSPHDSAFRQCWGLENLQPLWAKENRVKGDSLRSFNG